MLFRSVSQSRYSTRKIGITGQMGSGKSFVTRGIEKLGVPVFIMDIEARKIQETNQELIQKLQERFPECYKDGVLDRIKTREVLFADESRTNLMDMDSIIRPYLIDELNKFYENNKQSDYVLVESALIFEHGVEDLFDEIVLINADPVMRKRRAIERDGITEVDYDQRMKDQVPDEIKKSKSSYILDNDFSDNIRKKIHSLHQFLKQSK